jgi:N6-L-threonylcarbamoyladenine synthase
MKILGIESSCDETAAAVVEDGRYILSNIIASQVDIHARYGGIVPEVASRQHLLTIMPTIQEAIAMAGVAWSDLNAIAVTIGPGLAGSLLVGVNTAKVIAWSRGLPLIGVNHLEGHIYANWLDEGLPWVGASPFPLICLVVSGGHTDLILMKDHGSYFLLGKTRDDAAGEAFDKVARVLELGYPGGPAIEQVALGGNAAAHHFPRAWLGDSSDFSFSGLKTAVLQLVEGITQEEGEKHISRADIAASFQEAVVDVLVTKTIDAAKRYRVSRILLAGGVASNMFLRRTMAERSSIPVSFPRPILCTDNAAMIASCGYFHFRAGKTDGWDLDAVPSLRLG